jgi:hypothetical protein
MGMLRIVRYGIAALIALAGVVLIAAGGDSGAGAGVVLIGIAGLVLLANVFIRLSLQSEDDRAREERAREFFSRHGRWPRKGEDLSD